MEPLISLSLSEDPLELLAASKIAAAQQHDIASLRGASEVTGPLPPVVRGTPQVMRGGA